MKKRIFAFLMAMMMLISTVPAEVLATAPEENAEAELYFIDDTIWVPEGEEPTAPVVETGEWVKTEETMTESQLVCPEAEHTHYYNCPVDEEGNYTCGGGEEHVHVTDGCASDCAVAEHTHGEACYQQTTKVKWIVAVREDSYTTYANGTDLGWEYAIIEASYRNGQFRGYDLTDPTGNNHLGSHLTVTINGTAVSEYNKTTGNIVSNALSASTTGKVVISVNPGSPYYISEMILACGDRSSTPNPFNCDTKSTSDAYTFPISGTPTSVTANLSAIYNVANHGSNDDDYFIMIELAPLPVPVYVGYDSGTAGTHDIAARPVSETGSIEYTASGTAYTATPVGSYPTWSYPTAASTHSAFGISPEAEAEANTHGYSFAGWHLEYYTEYEDDSNEFSGEMTVGGTNLFKGASVTLTVHAKLTAIWQPMETLSVRKVWNDSDNQDGIRPDSVLVHLLRNGVHNGTPVTLSAENNWSATWNIPSKDENGQAITWSVEEVVPSGYISSVSGNAESGFVLTNTHTLERTSAHVQKIWKDDNNRDGVRPYGVQVQLYCNGEAVTSYTDASGNSVSGVAILTEAGSWSHEWLGLLKNQSGGTGEDNVYTVKETGYVDKDGNAVTNPGYDVEESTDAETGVLLITNTRQSATMDIPVEKKWNDADNQDNLRPTSVTVTLTANGESTGKSLTLNADNGWAGTFEDVHVYANGTPIYYSVIENEVAGYTMSLSGNSADGFVVTNTHEPETISVPVSKVWDDNNDQDGIRPDSITVQLYADGEKVEGKTLTLDAAGNWKGTFTDLTKYKDGKEIIYAVYEPAIENYNVVDGVAQSVTAQMEDGAITITNTHTPQTATLNVEKIWDDANNQDGKRPEAVQVTLYANGSPLLMDGDGKPVFEPVEGATYGQFTLVLKKSENWTGKWQNMPRFHNGQRISYTVVETGYALKETDAITAGVPKVYSIKHEYKDATTDNGKAIITNTYAPEKTSINVQKIWDDDDNRDNMRPASVNITLWQKVGDGEWTATNQTAVLSPENEWDCDFVDLPKYSGGQKIIYNVVEDAVAGYDAPSYDLDEATGVVTITNKRTVERVNVTVTKDWQDANNQDGIRPESIEVRLVANGYELTAEGTTVTLKEENNWTYTWTELYKNYAGKAITYSVEEINVPVGYTVTYPTTTEMVDGVETVQIKVTNSHVVEMTSVPVSKVWDDANDQDGIRPEAVEVTLFADGEVKDTIILHAGNNWRASFDGLEKNKAGAVAIKYTVEETGHYDKYDASVDTNERTAGAPENYVGAISGDAVNGYKITNTHEVEKTAITATKVWDDNNNQDGERPESITLHLLANGNHTGKSIVLNGTEDEDPESSDAYETGAWVASWTNLDKYAEGKEINYTVYEQAVGNGYVSSNDRVGNTVTITNTRTPEKTTFTVQKVWNDANNQDNVRYPGVAVQLYANGTAYGEPVVLNADGHWRYTWSGLDVNSAGQEVVYTVKEVYYVDYETVDGEKQEKQIELDEDQYEEPDGEYHGVLDAYTGINTVTNVHTPDTIEVSVTKVWDDADNQDGIRPDSVTVQLKRNGIAEGAVVELNAGNEWQYTWTVPVHHGIGIDNVYTVEEVILNGSDYVPGAPAGYEAKVTGDAASGYTITNQHTPETVSVPVSKVWDDNNDQDGIRPDEIVVTLQKKDGKDWVDIDTRKLNSDNNWSSSFDGLQMYKAGSVKELVEYRVQELNVAEGYAVSYDGYTITNKHTPQTATLNVKKVWEDANNQDGKRPEAVEITLYANGRPLLKDGSGNLVFGTVADEAGYERLVVILRESNNWAAKWDNMPRFHNGQRISYTVVETGHYDTYDETGTDNVLSKTVPEGYTVTHSYSGQTTTNGTATVTNKYTPELTDLNVQKVWDDDDNRAGKRPESVTVKLMKRVDENTLVAVKDAEGNDMTAVLSPANEWDYTFAGMAKYENGEEIVYEVVETELDSALGYEEAQYSYDRTTRIATITNTRHDEKIDVTVTKSWDDANNQDGMRPDSVVVTLYANGIDAKVSKTLNAGNNWTATFEDLYKHYKGQEVAYTVVETPVDGYDAEYTSSTDNEGNVTIQVENIHTPVTISIPVTKIWDDAENQDGIRPDSVEVTLYAGGVSTGKTATLSIDNNWTDTEKFVDLPKFANGEEIVYTVAEEAVDGYEVKAGSNAVNGGKIELINVHEPEETEVTATKIWDDDNDRDGKRPEKITLHLLADGDHLGQTYKIVLDGAVDSNGEIAAWKAQWTNLPKFKSGREIVYTVHEEITTTAAADAGISGRAITDYVPSYTFDPENWNNITVTNSYQPEMTQVNVLKVWNDGGDRDGMRPESIEVKLLADGEDTGKKLVLKAENNWTGEWNDLHKYRDHGTEIVYTVEETTVPLGYEAKTVQDTEFADNMFIITNTYEPQTTGVSVQKLWDDEYDNDGKRPDGIIVQLYANGSAVEGATVLLSDKNNWSYVWNAVGDDPLYVFDKGQVIRYYVDEIGYVIDGEEYENLPEGYEKTLVTESYSTTITNTHLTEKTSVSVEKVWTDSNNNDGFRPEKVSVTLYSNGQAVETVELNGENGWKHVWQNLYKYVAGEEAVYTVEETAVAEYDTTYEVTAGTDGGAHWTVTNTHQIKTKDMTVSKVWVDQSNTEKYRPDSVSVQLYKDGKAYGDVIVLSAKNEWKHPVTLPVYENGVQIVWTIAETKIPKYYSATYNQATLTVTNTIQSKEIPKTGDDSQLSMWMGMMVLSCAGIAVLLLDDRKRRTTK